LHPLIDTGTTDFKKVGNLGARVAIFKVSESEQSHFHLNGFLLARQFFEVDIV
jgi:hypothetical protein